MTANRFAEHMLLLFPFVGYHYYYYTYECYGRMAICLTFLFLYGIFFSDFDRCSPGEALFLEELTDFHSADGRLRSE